MLEIKNYCWILKYDLKVLNHAVTYSLNLTKSHHNYLLYIHFIQITAETILESIPNKSNT